MVALQTLPNRRFAWLLALIGAAIVLAIVVPLFRSGSAGQAGPAGLSGQPATVVTLRDDDGAAVSLRQLRGKVVVMNLWASWCPPCRAEMPDLQRFSQAYADRGVAVIGVNQGESARQARSFAQALHIRFAIWLDPGQAYGRAYAALGLPTTVVIGRDGTIVRGFDGPLSFDDLRSAVAGAIAAPR